MRKVLLLACLLFILASCTKVDYSDQDFDPSLPTVNSVNTIDLWEGQSETFNFEFALKVELVEIGDLVDVGKKYPDYGTPKCQEGSCDGYFYYALQVSSPDDPSCETETIITSRLKPGVYDCPPTFFLSVESLYSDSEKARLKMKTGSN